MRVCPSVVAAVLCLSAQAAWAQSSLPVDQQDGRLLVRATRITTPIVIDGKLDDEAYRTVTPFSEFIQQDPQEGAPATERTDSWILYDDENIYVSCRCWDSHPELIVANDLRRDSLNLRAHDNFAVELDTFHDLRNGVLFYVTPVGAMFDGQTSDERQNNADWNTVWDARATKFEKGWIAEMAIPFASLRYAPGRDQVWGINLRRQITSKNEVSYLSPLKADWGRGAIMRVSAAAKLTDLQVPPMARNIEIKPFAIAGIRTDRLSRPPLNSDVDGDVGVDAKYGVTKGLTADFTYNTDFAQVEQDEAQVNLTRFSLFFPEKREFFLEGQGLFMFGLSGAMQQMANAGTSDAPTLFYSRRIGLNNGRPVPIIGGGRLTGRLGAWTLGALNITSDDDEQARAVQTNFTALRLRRDVGRRSTVGVIVTSRNPSSAAASGSNHVWGGDASFSFFQNLYLSGYLAQSLTEGQRGDDLSYRGQFVYVADRFGMQLEQLTVEDNFNPETGFLRREDFRTNSATGRFSPRPRSHPLVRQLHYEAGVEHTTDNHGRVESREARAQFKADFHNSDNLTLTYTRNFEFVPLPFTLSEGIAVPIGSYTFDTFRVSYALGQQHRMSGTASLDTGSFYGGDKTTAAFRGRVEITTKLAVEPNISLNWITIPAREFTTTVAGARTTYTMTPRMYAAALIQYSSATSSLAANLRFRWEYQPGSELFVVYTEGRDTLIPGRVALEDRGFVVKINRLFRF